MSISEKDKQIINVKLATNRGFLIGFNTSLQDHLNSAVSGHSPDSCRYCLSMNKIIAQTENRVKSLEKILSQ